MKINKSAVDALESNSHHTHIFSFHADMAVLPNIGAFVVGLPEIVGPLINIFQHR